MPRKPTAKPRAAKASDDTRITNAILKLQEAATQTACAPCQRFLSALANQLRETK